MISEATRLFIPNSSIRDMNDRDLDNFLATFAVAEEAHESFNTGEITLDEYCQLLETAEVNIDSYLETVETNLETIGVL